MDRLFIVKDYLKNPYKNCTLQSKVPKLVTKEDCVLGIDEAGRGPVLGPMVYGVAFVPLSVKDAIKKVGFADSKTLTKEKRSEIFDDINSGKLDDLNVGWIVDVLSPIAISNSMLKRCKYNLNSLSHDTAMSLIAKAVETGVRVTEVYIDTVGPAEKYKAKVEERFPHIKVTVAKKADSIYPIVSAASICAKVVRDTVVSNWRFIEKEQRLKDIDYGSGYPSDPTTKDFLKKSFDPVFGFTTFVRFSWSTVSSVLDEKGVDCIWESDEDEEEAASNGSKSILDYYKRKNEETPKKSKVQKTSAFFKQRCLERVNSIF